jgi:hypothetical protein
MKTLLSFTVPPSMWFSGSPSNSALRELRKRAIAVSGKRAWERWGSAIDELPNPTDRDRLRELVSSMSMISNLDGLEADFRIPDAPSLESVNDLLDSRDYEEVLDRREASPYLEGEESDQAFERLFGFVLPWAQEWQIIDQFLLEQLLTRRAVFHLLVRNLHLLPPRTEIFSRLPRAGDSPQSVFIEPRLMRNIEELKVLFERENRELEIIAYSPHADSRFEKFPHPRLQKIRFNRGEMYTSLDNGFHRLAEKAPVVYSEVTNHEWTSARTALAALKAERII